jgi:hypothetical protein
MRADLDLNQRLDIRSARFERNVPNPIRFKMHSRRSTTEHRDVGPVVASRVNQLEFRAHSRNTELFVSRDLVARMVSQGCCGPFGFASAHELLPDPRNEIHYEVALPRPTPRVNQVPFEHATASRADRAGGERSCRHRQRHRCAPIVRPAERLAEALLLGTMMGIHR